MLRRNGVGRVAALALVVASEMAGARSTSEGDDGNTIARLATISVTGELQERDAQRSATSAVVLSGEDVERGNAIDLYDALRSVPNVSSSFGDLGFVVRGIAQSGPGGGENGLLVSLLVDGAAIPNAGATYYGPFGTWDLDRIEVLRGPQSTQQGPNALAGAIVVRTAAPVLDETAAKGRISVAGYDERRMSAAVNVPLVENIAALRVALDDQATDGYVDNPTRGQDDYYGRSAQTARAKVLVSPSESLTTTFTASVSDNRQALELLDLASWPGDRRDFSDAVNRSRAVSRILSLDLEYQIAERWRLDSITSRLDTDYQRADDPDRSAFPGNVTGINEGAESIKQEFRLNYESDALRGVIGLYLADDEIRQFGFGRLPAAAVLPNAPGTLLIDFLENDDVHNRALFGEIDWVLAPHWTLSAGVRYDRERREEFSRTTTSLDPPVIVLPQQPAIEGDSTYDATLPKVGVTRDWNEDVSTSVTVQRAYRAGGIAISLVSGAGGPYEPESATNYEFALRTQWLDDRFRFNANLFYLDWEDQQVTLIGPTGNPNDTFVGNAGESTVRGLEVQLDAFVSDDLRLDLSAALNRTRFDRFVQRGVDLAGNRFPFASERSASLGLEWRPTRDWVVYADASYLSEFFSDAENSPLLRVPSRTLANLRVGIERETWSAFAFARNLFDRDYATQFTGSPNDEAVALRAGDPRVIGIEVALVY
jgi:outer membrane receptor protein involved in Fe transport